MEGLFPTGICSLAYLRCLAQVRWMTPGSSISRSTSPKDVVHLHDLHAMPRCSIFLESITPNLRLSIRVDISALPTCTAMSSRSSSKARAARFVCRGSQNTVTKRGVSNPVCGCSEPARGTCHCNLRCRSRVGCIRFLNAPKSNVEVREGASESATHPTLSFRDLNPSSHGQSHDRLFTTLISIENSGHRPFMHHSNAIAGSKNFLHVTADH